MGQIDEAKVKRLRTEVPHSTDANDLPADYKSHFAPHSEEGACLYCGEAHTFTWGIAHGAGHCYKCGWPARLYHFTKGDDGAEKRTVLLLQYHPSEIILPGEKRADEEAA